MGTPNLCRSLHVLWQQAHASSILLVRTLVANTSAHAHASVAASASATAAATANLRVGTLDAALVRQWHSAVGAMAALEQLRMHLDELDGLLDAMHSAVADARHNAGSLSLNTAIHRNGPHDSTLSPADRCAALAAPLRGYESELALKHALCDAFCWRPHAAETHLLVLAWESQLQLIAEGVCNGGVAYR